MRSPSLFPAAALITFLSVLSFDPSLAATEYLVVTTDEMASAFEGLADLKADQGYETEVVTLEDLAAMSLPGRDVAEQIRTYIQAVHAQGSLRFVLLGGDTGQLPARLAFSEFYPSAGTEIPTDLYFAALDGDWDADEDDVFGEVEVDDADMDPDVAVGRVPANTALEAAQYVAKVGQYENTAHAAHLKSALYLDEVLFPVEWNPGDPISLDGAVLGEELRAIVEGGSTPMTDQRFYENHLDYPGSGLLSRQQAIDVMSSGDHGLVLHAGHGNTISMSMGDEIFTPADALSLANGPHQFVLMTLIPFGAAFDDDAILEEFVRNPDGGAVAVIGYSRASFVMSAQDHLESINEQLFQLGAQSIGEALNAVRAARAEDAQLDNFWRYAQLTLNLLGDPEVGVGKSALTSTTPASGAARLRMLSIAPNPFNPSVTIRFELTGEVGSRAPVTVSVFDLSGRRVRSLWDSPLSEGPQAMVWDGRDDAGVALASGVYFAAVESGEERRSAKMVLLK